MEPEAEIAANSGWEVVPTHPVAWVIYVALFAYFFFRHFQITLMVIEFFVSLFRSLGLIPGEGKRFKAVVHWLIAGALFFGFGYLGNMIGWVEFVPHE